MKCEECKEEMVLVDSTSMELNFYHKYVCPICKKQVEERIYSGDEEDNSDDIKTNRSL